MNNFCVKTRQEVAEELGVSYSTLYRWLKRQSIEVPKRRYLRPAEYQEIMERWRG